jgi:hypothetical protein
MIQQIVVISQLNSPPGQGNSTYFSKPRNRQEPEKFLTAKAKKVNKMCESMLFFFPFRLLRRCGQSFFSKIV